MSLHRPTPAKRQARKGKEDPGLKQIKDLMSKIADQLNQSSQEMRQLMKLRREFGDDLYFRTLGDAYNLQAAFAEWVVLAKYPTQEPEWEE